MLAARTAGPLYLAAGPSEAAPADAGLDFLARICWLNSVRMRGSGAAVSSPRALFRRLNFANSRCLLLFNDTRSAEPSLCSFLVIKQRPRELGKRQKDARIERRSKRASVVVDVVVDDLVD